MLSKSPSNPLQKRKPGMGQKVKARQMSGLPSPTSLRNKVKSLAFFSRKAGQRTGGLQ